jgi:hypothetical protein
MSNLTSSPVIGIVILGMHRSGTSALTGLLNVLGIPAGRKLLPVNKYNERGYFEAINLVKQHDVLLKLLDRSWSDVRLFPTKWFDQNWVAEASEKLADQFLAEFDLKRQWALKDPRICRLLPVWKLIFAKLHIKPNLVFMLRHPLEVAASLEMRDGIMKEHALLLYSIYLLEAERESRNYSRVVVKYTDLLSDWRQVLQMIQNNMRVMLPEMDDDFSRLADTFLSRDLQHHHFIPEERKCTDSESQAYEIATNIYDLLNRSDPFCEPKKFDELWGQLEQYLDKNPWIALAQRAQYQRDRLINFMTRGLLQPDANIEKMLGHGAMSAIYWCSKSDPNYSEAKVIKLPLHYGPKETLRFAVPAESKKLSRMRWDIAERGILCEIFKAWVENPQKDKVWQWEHQMPLFSDLSSFMKVIHSTSETNRLFIISTGFDPYGELLIPSEVIAQMEEGWAFVAVISVSLPTMAIPILCDLLKEYETEIEKIKELSVRHDVAVGKTDYKIPCLAEGLEEVLTSLSTTLAKRDNIILNQQQQLEQLGQELIRAEAQLDLLKDVMLSKSDSDTF